MESSLNQNEIFRYARHLTIPEVGLEGQKKLKAASALIIGAGGLGSPIALYLAAAGVGRIGLVDFDTVDISNLQRQVIHDTQHVGQLKVLSARERMLAINPLIQVDMYAEKFSPENAERIAAEYDLLMDGTDNLYTRYLINDVCVLQQKAYIFGSVYQFEGQTSVFKAPEGPCYRCIFSEPPPPEALPKGVQLGVFGALPGTIGSIQAAEAIKQLTGIGTPLTSSLLLYDALNMEFHKIRLQKNPKCPVCGENPSIHSIRVDNPHYITPMRKEVPASDLITAAELQTKFQIDQALQIIDVRQPVELQISKFPGAVNIPLHRLEEKVENLDPALLTILISRTGERAAQALKILKSLEFNQVKILQGGLDNWAENINPTIMRY